ncbi:MAG: hypothetical protein WCN98_07630 [Verrucomicrobiaceae bacterium]
MRTVAIVVLAIVAAIPAHAGCTSSGACAGNVFTVSPQGNILGFNGQAAARQVSLT